MNLNIHSSKRTSLFEKLFQWAAVWLIFPSAICAGAVVTECTEAALRAAMAGGGTVTFACDGTITLANTLTNAADLTLDATGHQVTISGSNAVRVFYVPPNVTLAIINLTIANGSGNEGGGILNVGVLALSRSTFASNACRGGDGGGGGTGNANGLTDGGPGGAGGDARGGAVCNLSNLVISASTFFERIL